MDKKLFEELIEGVKQMADHAAGKKVKGVREVVKEVEMALGTTSNRTRRRRISYC